MIQINFSNAEELIFANSDVQKLLPVRFFAYFEQWKLGKRFPMLGSMGKSAILDLLNQLKDEDISILEDYFGERVYIERLNYKAVQNLKLPLKDATICQALCELVGFSNFSTWRDDEYLYISSWK